MPIDLGYSWHYDDGFYCDEIVSKISKILANIGFSKVEIPKQGAILNPFGSGLNFEYDIHNEVNFQFISRWRESCTQFLGIENSLDYADLNEFVISMNYNINEWKLIIASIRFDSIRIRILSIGIAIIAVEISPLTNDELKYAIGVLALLEWSLCIRSTITNHIAAALMKIQRAVSNDASCNLVLLTVTSRTSVIERLKAAYSCMDNSQGYDIVEGGQLLIITYNQLSYHDTDAIESSKSVGEEKYHYSMNTQRIIDMCRLWVGRPWPKIQDTDIDIYFSWGLTLTVRHSLVDYSWESALLEELAIAECALQICEKLSDKFLAQAVESTMKVDPYLDHESILNAERGRLFCQLCMNKVAIDKISIMDVNRQIIRSYYEIADLPKRTSDIRDGQNIVSEARDLIERRTSSRQRDLITGFLSLLALSALAALVMQFTDWKNESNIYDIHRILLVSLYTLIFGVTAFCLYASSRTLPPALRRLIRRLGQKLHDQHPGH